MAIFDTFSKRQKRLNGEVNDVYVYDRVGSELRVQIVRIWDQAFGSSSTRSTNETNPAYRILQKDIATEFGLRHLNGRGSGDYLLLVNFFMEIASDEQALDMIDMAFAYLSGSQVDAEWGRALPSWKPLFRVTIGVSDAIDQLNRRFMEHGVGYEFLGGTQPGLIRKDNEHIHREAVVPALQLLREPGFEGANDEYRSAHEHYRHSRQKECLNDCLKAFESTMKTICTQRGWTYDPQRDTASALIAICLNNGLLPRYMQSHLGTVKSALESAIPTMRNRESGHGAGLETTNVPQYFAEYLLHETATTIVFLVDAHKALS